MQNGNDHLTKPCRRFLATLLFLGLLTLTIKQNAFLKAQLIQETRQPQQCQRINVWKIAELKWGRPLKLNLSEERLLTNTSFSAVDYSNIPGPKNYPSRPILIPYVNFNGIAGEIRDGGRQNDSNIILLKKTPEIISLPTKPYNISVRNGDGIWVLFGDRLVHYTSKGVPKLTIKNPGGTRLVSVEGNAVWLLSLTHAWFVNSDGQIRGSWQWHAFSESAGIGKSLCYLQKRFLRCLEPNGKENSTVIDWLEEKPRPSRLLSFTFDTLLTGEISSLHWHKKGKNGNILTIQNAGLTNQEDAFVSVLSSDNWADVCLPNGKSHSVPVSYRNPSFRFPPNPKLSVIAVEDDRTLTYGYDQAIWYGRDRSEQRFIVDEQKYRSEVFPYLWEVRISDPMTVRDSRGTVVLAASGPTGIALIGLSFKD